MAQELNRKIINPDGTTSYISGESPEAVNTAITAASLAPTNPINVPPAPTPTYTDIGGINSVIGANEKMFPTNADAGSTDIWKWLEQSGKDQATRGTAADTISTLESSMGISTKEQNVNTAAAAEQSAREKYGALNAQLQQYIYNADTLIPAAQQQAAEGRGITAAGLAPIQAAELRKNALAAAPIQFQALIAQSELANAQGRTTLAQNILTQAENHLAKIFQVQQTDSTNEYNYKKDLRDKVFEFATAAEKAKLDKLQKEDDRKFTLLQDSINNAQDFAKTAIENGQGSLAGQLMTLDPKDPTYSTKVASLAGQIRPKATAESAPTSYKEWELAGKPGTYAQWLKDANIKAPTVAQQTVAEYAARIEQAIPTLETLTPTITGMNLLNFNTQLRLPPTFQSTEMQQYMQAASNFINAKLRRESGAVISPTEFTEARSQYLPQPGDKEEVLKQKKNNRDLVFASLRKAAGNAYESVNDLLAQDQGMGATGGGTVGSGQPGTIEYPIGSGKQYSVDAQGNMTPL